jgi:hypothetical protein
MFEGNVFQPWAPAVLEGKNRVANRPLNPQIWITPQDAVLILWSVKSTTPVHHICDIAKHTETMRKSFSHVYLSPILFRQLTTHPFTERGRSAPNVHSHIENRPSDDLKELCLGTMELIMEPPKHIFH